MMVSTKGRYALRVMLDLAEYGHGGHVSLADISARQEISLKYLEAIVAALSKAGFLESRRGKTGGYRLARPVNAYTVGSRAGRSFAGARDIVSLCPFGRSLTGVLTNISKALRLRTFWRKK